MSGKENSPGCQQRKKQQKYMGKWLGLNPSRLKHDSRAALLLLSMINYLNGALKLVWLQGCISNKCPQSHWGHLETRMSLMKFCRIQAAESQQFRFAQKQEFLAKNVGISRHWAPREPENLAGLHFSPVCPSRTPDGAEWICVHGKCQLAINLREISEEENITFVLED